MQVLSSLSGIPFYAPSAGFAPTNSADVSAIASAYAESAASSKLDSTASSSFYPSDNPSGFISGVDLSDYATTAYVDSSVSGKLDTTAQVVTSIGVAAGALSSINGYGLSAGLANSAGTATVWLGASSKLDASAASDFALTEQLEDYLEKTASSQFLTAVPDGYATTEYVDSSISGFAYESAVSGWTAKQDALTFGYDTSDKISSINGSSLAGEGGGLVTSIQTAQDPWYQQSISGLNGSSIYPKWAESAISAQYAHSASSASQALSAAAAPTGWASSFISSVSSPSGTIRVMNGNEIEGTNSAVLPSTVVEGFSVISSIPQSLTAFSFTVPTSNPNTQVIITGGWATGNFGISGDNGVTAESSVNGFLNVTFDMPGSTAFDVTSEAWVSDIGYTASALDSEVGGGIAELAWASALPTYQYDASDKISAINGSALAGGAQVNADWAESASSSPSYIENKPDLVDIVAGPGIVVDNPDGNTLRVSQQYPTDETVLFTKTWNDQKWSETLSEPITNFERIRIEWSRGDSGLVAYTYNVSEHYVDKINNVAMMQCGDIDYPGGAVYRYFTIYKINGSSYVESYASYYQYGGTLTGWQTANVWLHPIKIVGIHRIANN